MRPIRSSGGFTAHEPFTELDGGIIIAASPSTTIQSLHVIASTLTEVPTVQGAVLTTLNQPGSEVRVQAPADLAQLRDQIMGDVENYGNAVLFLVMISGASLTAMVVAADVLVNRADLGRRRALGAQRWVIISLVTGRSVLSGALGGAVGATTTWLALHIQGILVPWTFTLGTAILATLAAGFAAVAPAIAASVQDPVRVLRTP